METLKSGFGPQFNGFMQPFDGGLYAGYSSYNNWDTKIPGPLGSKSFPWGLNSVNPLPNVVSSPSAMCFSSPTGAANSMGTSMVPGSMNVHTGVGSNVSNPTSPCPYAAPAPPYLYNREQCSSSIATLRLKAKQHSSVTNFAYPAVPTRQPTLSACQYAAVGNGTGMV